MNSGLRTESGTLRSDEHDIRRPPVNGAVVSRKESSHTIVEFTADHLDSQALIRTELSENRNRDFSPVVPISEMLFIHWDDVFVRNFGCHLLGPEVRGDEVELKAEDMHRCCQGTESPLTPVVVPFCLHENVRRNPSRRKLRRRRESRTCKQKRNVALVIRWKCPSFGLVFAAAKGS